MIKRGLIGLWAGVLLTLFACSQATDYEQSAQQLAGRLVPGHEKDFIFTLVPAENDVFELKQHGDQIEIQGNNGVSMARGLNHYLRHYCHASVSWCGNNLSGIPDTLPRIASPLRIEASQPFRYYLNYCTYSYSMAFWGWEEWEQEIDRMALQGINLPLMAVNSQYAVWQNTLKRLGYTDDEIFAFLPGAGYEAWWLMGNLEGFGGPVSQAFIDRQTDLQKKMLRRMRELGMQPVFQGFYGMVPNSLKEKFPQAHILEQGEWCTYQRPAFLDPNDPLFDSIADIYYAEQKRLFGDALYFAGDPFHEGGQTEGIDVKAAAGKILQAMRRISPNAVWILQGWQHNPMPSLMEGLKQGDAIILDLMACERPQWGGIPSSMFYKPEGHMYHNWIWCALPNFGGKTGLHGKMSSYASGPVFAKHHPLGKNLCGIGAAPEGIGTIPVVYDMVYDMAWRNDSLNVTDWLREYTHYRYGEADSACNRAWEILARTIYECHNETGGPVESYICARPADTIKHVSAWGNAEIFYDPDQVVTAWETMYASRNKFRNSDTYRYDLVDLTRQVLSDYLKALHRQAVAAFQHHDTPRFTRLSARMLDIIRDDDRLLSTRKEFYVGTWIGEAEKAGTNPQEKKRFVANAKRQITTWTDYDSELHDYAHKEWGGLLRDLYLPRWEAWVNYKLALLKGEPAREPDYFGLEKAWVTSDKTYDEGPSGDSIAIIEELYKQYIGEIRRTYKNI